MQGRLEGVCLGALQGELGLKSSTQHARSARTPRNHSPLYPVLVILIGDAFAMGSIRQLLDDVLCEPWQLTPLHSMCSSNKLPLRQRIPRIGTCLTRMKLQVSQFMLHI